MTDTHTCACPPIVRGDGNDEAGVEDLRGMLRDATQYTGTLVAAAGEETVCFIIHSLQT